METKKVYKTPELKSQKIKLGVFGNYDGGGNGPNRVSNPGSNLGRTISDMRLE